MYESRKLPSGESRLNSGACGVGDKSSPRGKIWVRRDPEGTVLRQQAMLLDSTVIFDRMTDEQTIKQLKAVGDKWWDMEADIPAKKHD